jgi:acyl-CoA reductase-like NAD-dependent aldehyde dehydrogenase
MLRLAAIIEDQAERYVSTEVAGTGKPALEAADEVAQSVDLIRFYAGAARTGTVPASGHLLSARESWVRWEPVGVVAAVLPWNYPLMMAIWRAAPAVAAGNSVVLKPAETTPDSAALLAAHASEALGPGVLTVVCGGQEVGRRLVDAPVDMVAFTGSVAGGRDVRIRAGLRRTSLELGGNCPAIVLPDASDQSCLELVRASTYNAGQSCAAPARVITLPENYDQVVACLVEAARTCQAGTDFGPLNNAQQAARFDSIMARSQARVREEGTLAIGETEEAGYWRPATILADLPDNDPAVMEEVFGPVLTVQAATSVSQALQLANGVPQALAASVWGSDTSTLLGLARDLDAGEVWVNCHLEQTGELPHGGRRRSGDGTDLSTLALQEYQRPKTITVNVATPLDM